MSAVALTVNGKAVTADVDPRTLLVQFLREHLRLTGTHVGCDTSQCGACVVHVDGKAVKSCTVFAVQANGHEIKTVEGLAQGKDLHPIQEGFFEKHGLQCGFCTPGMMMTACALLEQNHNPSEEEIRWGISGNLCRCTGYVNIVEAIRYAAEKMYGGEAAPVETGSRTWSASRLGAARIAGLSVPQTARTRPNAAKIPMAARSETAPSSAPAASGPSGAASRAIVLHVDSERPSSRSGVIAMR